MHTTVKIACVDYLYQVLRPNGLGKITRETVKMIRDTKLKFDSIAFTGMSGSLVGPAVAIRLRKNPVVIRKTGDGSHSGQLIEAMADIGDYIIIDDFRSSGATIKRIIEAMDGVSIVPERCKGIFLYTGNSGTFGYVDIDNKEYLIPIFGRYK